MKDQEILDRVEGRLVYFDLPAKMPAKPKDFEIAAARLPRPVVAVVLDSFKSIYGKAPAGQPESEWIDDKNNKARTGLQEAAQEYVQSVPEGAEFDPIKFRELLEANKYSQVRTMIDQIRKAAEDCALLGLTDVQLHDVRQVLLSGILGSDDIAAAPTNAEITKAVFTHTRSEKATLAAARK